MAIEEKVRVYLKSSGTGVVSKAVMMLSSLASVWLLNQILLKAGYGNYEFSLALISTLLIFGSGGLQYVVMYRISRMDEEPETLAGHEVAGAILGWSILLSLLIIGGVAVSAPWIASLTGKAGLEFWIGGLVLLIPTRVALGIYKNWYQARQLVAESLIFGDISPAAARALFLIFAWLLWPTPEGVVVAILVGELLPLVVWFARSPLNPFHLFGVLSGWDVQYAIKLMFTRSLSKSVKRSDVLMMGVLATSGATAGYVVASKIATLLLVGHQLMNMILTPRIGRFLSKDATGEIQREYRQSRVLGLIIALLGAFFIAAFGPWVLGIFGDYADAMPVMLVLAATYVAQVSFGMCGGYLNIAGYANWTLVTTAMVLLVNVGLNYLLIPPLGASGAAVAMLVSVSVTNALTAYLVYDFDGVQTYSLRIAALVMIVSVALMMAAFGETVSNEHVGVVVLGVLALFLWSERSFLTSLGRSFFDAFRSTTAN